MTDLFFPIVAIIGAGIHLWREKPDSRQRRAEIFLLWWLVLAIGVGSIVAAGYHVFDGTQIAEEIGFTRGDGGFQFENAMGDLSVGVAGVLCFRIRGLFWLAVLIVMSIQYWGDAYGHIYQSIEYNNDDPDNVGIPLYYDFVAPAVGWALYALMGRERRAVGAAEPRPAPGS